MNNYNTDVIINIWEKSSCLWGEFKVRYHDDLKEKKFSIFLCPNRKKCVHTHEFLELAYVLKGQAEHQWDKNYADIKTGDYFIVDYRSRHSYVAKTEDFELINCLFLPELIEPSLVGCRSLQTLLSSYQIHFRNEFFTASPSVSIFKEDDGKIKNLLLSMLDEFEKELPGYMQVIRSRLIEILVLTMRKIYIDPHIDSENSSMDAILRYINSCYMNEITLNEICRKFGYSFSYLSMKFKKELGISYTGYLQRVRIEQSMRMLAFSDKPVSEIAHAVGYHDIKSFYSVFKKIADTTPARFRKNYSAK